MILEEKQAKSYKKSDKVKEDEEMETVHIPQASDARSRSNQRSKLEFHLLS
jgi:hypothetical protein